MAELEELLSQAIFLGIGAWVCVVEECAGGDTASEPFMLGEADDKWAELILNFRITHTVTDCDEGLRSLFTDDCFL